MRETKQPLKQFFTIEQDGREVSRAAVIIDYKPDGRPSATIEDVWTEPAYRKRGLAGQCVDQCVEFARQNNCYKVVLVCGDENVHFYEGLGFHLHQLGMRLNLHA